MPVKFFKRTVDFVKIVVLPALVQGHILNELNEKKKKLRTFVESPQIKSNEFTESEGASLVTTSSATKPKSP